jgi:hypothetical protein
MSRAKGSKYNKDNKRRQRRKLKVKHLILSDHSLNQIVKLTGWNIYEVTIYYNEIKNDLVHETKSLKKEQGASYFGEILARGFYLGSKNEPYYDPLIYTEEYLMNLPPNYDFNRLSDLEKAMYLSPFVCVTDPETDQEPETVGTYRYEDLSDQEKQIHDADEPTEDLLNDVDIQPIAETVKDVERKKSSEEIFYDLHWIPPKKKNNE